MKALVTRIDDSIGEDECYEYKSIVYGNHSLEDRTELERILSHAAQKGFQVVSHNSIHDLASKKLFEDILMARIVKKVG